MTDFVVPRWLRSPHLQTLGAAAPLFARPAQYAHLPNDELRIPLPVEPAGRYALHAKAWWAAGVRPAVLVVHGIGGSSASNYVLRAAVALHRAGYHVVRLDLRGAGASIPDAPTLYHAGLTSDVGLAVEYLARDARVSGVFLLGFSGGGSLALKLAGQWAGEVPPAVRGIISVSAPLDYTRVGPWMDRFARLPYRFHVLRGLANGAREFARQHPERAHYRPEDVRRVGPIRAYDAKIIAPMHGFPDVDTYYREASAGPWLSSIRVPTLLVHAADDPMVPDFSVLPWLEKVSPAVDVAISPHGGHIGWVEGFDEPSWIAGFPMRRTLAFLAATK